jgi:hypothetical protein
MLTSFLLPRDPRNAREGGPGIDRKAATPSPVSHRVTVRLAEPSDREAIERLAALDSARVPKGTLVVADLAGSIQAAVPVEGGRAIANPFAPTADLVRLLELRAAQLRDAAGLVEREDATVIPLPRRVQLADRPA